MFVELVSRSNLRKSNKSDGMPHCHGFNSSPNPKQLTPKPSRKSYDPQSWREMLTFLSAAIQVKTTGADNEGLRPLTICRPFPEIG